MPISPKSVLGFASLPVILSCCLKLTLVAGCDFMLYMHSNLLLMTSQSGINNIHQTTLAPHKPTHAIKLATQLHICHLAWTHAQHGTNGHAASHVWAMFHSVCELIPLQANHWCDTVSA